MRSKYTLILLFICFISLKTNAQNLSSDFKIVGYYPINAAMKADTSQVPFDKFTHINLAFVNSDVSGNFNQNFDALVPFIKAAHRHNVKVLYSIAGGGGIMHYHALLKEDKRQGFIENLVSKVRQYDVDGIDVDLESGYAFGAFRPETDPNYGIFIIELAQVLRSHNKLITTALPGHPDNYNYNFAGKIYPNDVVTHKVLTTFDFINIMSYDHTFKTRPDRKGNHSSYSDAMDDLDYYRNTLMVPKEKLILGEPFYGYGFGLGLSDPVIGDNYKDIVSTYAGAKGVDHWHLPNSYIMYYNGIPTIKNKTELAKKEAGGVMIWQILGDDPTGEKSLLNAIYEAAR